MKIKSLAVTKYFFEPLVSYYHSDDNRWFDGKHFYYQDTQVAYRFYAKYPVLFLSLENYPEFPEMKFIIQELKERSPLRVIPVPFLPNDNFSGREGEFSLEMLRRFVQRLRAIQLEQRADFSKIREREFLRIKKYFREFLAATELQELFQFR